MIPSAAIICLFGLKKDYPMTYRWLWLTCYRRIWQ